MAPAAPARSSLQQLPRSVWVLGLVSLFMDLSSEMIHALLPLYLVTVLGASMVEVGVIEGIAEATAMIVKIFSGALSDWLGRRKAAGGRGLRARRLHQAGVSAGHEPAVDRRGAFRRPHRQGHPRRAARCADRRYHAERVARRRLRPAPGARYGRRLSRAVGRDRADVAERGSFPAGVLDRGHSGHGVVCADRLRGQGTGASARRPASRPRN